MRSDQLGIPSFLLLLLLLLLCSASHVSSLSLNHYSSISPSSPPYLTPSSLTSDELRSDYIHLTKPLPSDHLTLAPPCTLSFSFALLLRHHSHYPPSPNLACYSPPSDCLPLWSHVILQIQVTARTVSPSHPSTPPPTQPSSSFSDVLSLQLDGVELLRTSSPADVTAPHKKKAFWEVRKDVTRYSSLFLRRNLNLTLVPLTFNDGAAPLTYQVNASLSYYDDDYNHPNADQHKFRNNTLDRPLNRSRKQRSSSVYPQEVACITSSRYDRPASWIIPLSSGDSDDNGRTSMDQQSGTNGRSIMVSKRTPIPSSTCRLVLELRVSSHGSDEFWYSKVPFDPMNKTNVGAYFGAFREVVVKIDGNVVGTQFPSPIISPGSINPYLWRPIVLTGVFDIPSDDVELTPFLYFLLDCKEHRFSVEVSPSTPSWLVHANLHLWFDHDTPVVQAKPIIYRYPPLDFTVGVSNNADNAARGALPFEIETTAKRHVNLSGWVGSSAGNFTTQVSLELEFKNLVKYDYEDMRYLNVPRTPRATVYQEIGSEGEVTVVSSATGEVISRTVAKRRNIVVIEIRTHLISDVQMYNTVVNVTVQEEEKRGDADVTSSYCNVRHSRGHMIVRDRALTGGTGETAQVLSHKDKYGRFYSRTTVSAPLGELVKDEITHGCAAPA